MTWKISPARRSGQALQVRTRAISRANKNPGTTRAIRVANASLNVNVKKVRPWAHLLHLNEKNHLVWTLKKSHEKIRGKNLPIRQKQAVKQKSQGISRPET